MVAHPVALIAALLIGPAVATAGEADPDTGVHVEPVVAQARDLHDHKPRWRLSWPAGPRVVRLGDRVLTRDATRSLTTPRLAPGTVLTVEGPDVREDVVLEHLVGPRALATLSGPGLAGARVVDVEPTARGPWVATDGGGAAWWDGEAFRALDARHGLPSDRVLHVSVSAQTRWFATDRGLVRAASDGTLTAFDLVADDLAADAAGAWVLADGEVWRVDAVGASVVGPVQGGCTALLDWHGETVASCPEVVRLPGGTPVPELLGLPPGVTGLVPRRDGAWAITPSGLHQLVDHVLVDETTPAIAGAVDLLRVGSSLMIVDVSGALLRLDPDGVLQELRQVDGLPSDVVLSLAPGPREGTAWVGTDRGLALVEEDGDAVSLPLAPLAVGRGARRVLPHKRGAVVLSDDGPVWLGDRPPRGWDAFAVAAAEHPLDLLAVGDHVLALTEHALIVLGPKGAIERFPTGSWRPLGLLGAADAAAIVLQEGLRAWIPGARQLSSRDGAGTWRGASISAGGTLLWHDAGVTRLGVGGWSAEVGVQDLAFAGAGWWVTTPRGMRWLDTEGEVGPRLPDVPPLRGLRPLGGAFAGLDPDGRLWTLTPSGLAAPGPAFLPTASALDPWGAGLALRSQAGATLWRPTSGSVGGR